MTILNLCLCTLQQRTVAHAGFVCRLLRFQFLFLSSFYFANFIVLTNFYTVYVSILSSSIHVLLYVLFILQCTYFVKDECEIIIVYWILSSKIISEDTMFQLEYLYWKFGQVFSYKPMLYACRIVPFLRLYFKSFPAEAMVCNVTHPLSNYVPM